jgi:hypothetical protein
MARYSTQTLALAVAGAAAVGFLGGHFVHKKPKALAAGTHDGVSGFNLFHSLGKLFKKPFHDLTQQASQAASQAANQALGQATDVANQALGQAAQDLSSVLPPGINVPTPTITAPQVSAQQIQNVMSQLPVPGVTS